jgi:hypothetical protein
VPPNPYTWEFDTYNPYEGAGYATCLYDPTYTSTQDEWLISPSFSLDGLSDAELSFAWFSSYYWGYDPYDNYDLEVYARTNGGSWDFLWVEDDEAPWTNWQWYPKTLDFSDYDGETDVQIALVYYGYDGAEGAFDAILVTGTTGGNGGNGDDNETEELPITVYNQTHYVDLEPPTSWITLELDHDGNMITPYTEFTIWQEDFACDQPGGSQCCMIHYRIDGVPGQMFYGLGQVYYPTDGAWHTGAAGSDTPISFQIRDPQGFIKAGKYIVEFYAEDCLGNIEPIIHRHIYYPDTDSPLTTLLFSGPHYEDWITDDTKITLKSSDGDSGTLISKYQIDDGPLNTYTGPFTIPTEGTHTIKYYSVDNVNNKGPEQVTTITVDSTAPTAGLVFEGDAYESAMATWITSDTLLQLPASDIGCGLKAIYYRLDGGEWTEYTDAFTLTQGELIEFYAEDNLGNTMTTQKQAIGVDTEAPSITYIAPEGNHLYIAGREILSLRTESIIIGSLRIEAAATDACGIDRIELYIDGEQRYSEHDGSQLQWLWDERSLFEHTITIKAYDHLGRVSTKETTVKIFNI